MNTSFKQIRQSSLRQNRNSSRVVSSHSHHRGPSRLPSSTGQESFINSNEPESARDGVVELTKNTKYCVSRLPAIPVVLKGGNNEISTGLADQNTNHALVVSNDKTFVWDYSSPDHVPNTVNFPAGAGAGSEPPLATLVAPAPGSREPGLVTVNTTSGLITYWEAIGGAVADGLLHRRKSIQHEVGVYAGEWIDNLQNVEPAGIVITTSSGRYILITLRDSNGKPAIHSQTMRGGGTGLLSAFKGAILPQGHRRGVVSIKLGNTTGRSEQQALIINENGDLSVWECSRSGYAKVLMDEHFRDVMLNHITPLYPHAAETFTVHDVELNEPEECIYILSSFAHNESEVYYVLYTITIKNKEIKIYSTHRIQTYTQPSTRPPKLLFPEPHSTLFAVFSHGVVLLEAMPERNPDLTLSRRWEDVITFRHEVTIEGAGKEDIARTNGKITRNCGIVLLASKAGVIRIERFEDETRIPVEKKQTALEPELAKSKVEQAVFYGYDAGAGFNNPVDFDQRSAFSPDVLERVVLQVSNEILTTKSVYMPPILPSLNEHLEMRVACLQRLARYIHDNYPPDQLSIAARLQLLWDLQKTVVAKALWSHVDKNLYEESVNVLVTVINDQAKNSSSGDPLRDWFLQKANVIDQLLVRSSKYCSDTKDIGILIDTNSILLEAIYKSALNVENEYSPILGLDKSSACEHAPWVSSPEMIKAFETQYNLTKTAYSTVEKDEKKANELSSQLLFLVESLCAIYSQRLSWIANSPSTAKNNNKDEGEKLSAVYAERRGGWLREVVNTGNKLGALRIAEDFSIYRSLVEILVEDWKLSSSSSSTSGEDHLNALKNYMVKSGYDFAAVLYQYLLETNQLKTLLTIFPEFGQYLDRFFKSKKQTSRISWVNDVNKERFLDAGKALLDSNASEDLSSNNKLRLSIAKLCVLNQPSGESKVILHEVNSQLQVANAQDALKTQLSVAGGGDDDPLNYLIEQGRKSLHKVAKRVLSRMEQNRSIGVEELVDLLTLVKVDTNDGKLNYYRALKIVSESALSPERKSVNEHLIWQRLFLADDWSKIVNTKSKSDAKVQQVIEKTILYQTLLKGLEDEIISEQAIDYMMEPKIITQDVPNLSQRYAYASDSQVSAIVEDIKAENETIINAVDKYSLDSWTKGIFSRVQTVIGASSAGSKPVSSAPSLKMDLS